MIHKRIPLILFLFLPVVLFAQYFGEEKERPSSWSLGIQGGVSFLDADVATEAYGKQGSLFFQKKLGRVFDLRIAAQVGQVRGLDLHASSNHRQNPFLNGTANPAVNYDSSSTYFHNYEHTHGRLGVTLKINLNRIVTVIGAEKWDLYALGGLGIYGYETRINALNQREEVYDFPSWQMSNQDLLQERLGKLLDDTYESPAEQDFINNTFVGPYALKGFFLAGGGIRFFLTKDIGLGLEGTYLFVGDDLLDGQQWGDEGTLSPNRDKLISLGLLLDLAF